MKLFLPPFVLACLYHPVRGQQDSTPSLRGGGIFGAAVLATTTTEEDEPAAVATPTAAAVDVGALLARTTATRCSMNLVEGERENGGDRRRLGGLLLPNWSTSCAVSYQCNSGCCSCTSGGNRMCVPAGEYGADCIGANSVNTPSPLYTGNYNYNDDNNNVNINSNVNINNNYNNNNNDNEDADSNIYPSTVDVGGDYNEDSDSNITPSTVDEGGDSDSNINPSSVDAGGDSDSNITPSSVDAGGDSDSNINPSTVDAGVYHQSAVSNITPSTVNDGKDYSLATETGSSEFTLPQIFYMIGAALAALLTTYSMYQFSSSCSKGRISCFNFIGNTVDVCRDSLTARVRRTVPS